MDKLIIKNKRVLELLQNISDTVLSEDYDDLYNVAYKDRLGRDGKGYNDGIDIDSGTSHDYHKFMMNLDKQKKHEGFPESALLVDYKNSPIVETSIKSRDRAISITQELTSELGAEHNSLLCYYPVNGYIGWHHNANAGGYNVLFTFHDSNGGYFEEYDMIAGKYIKHEDGIGWSAKTGYFGSFDDPEEKKVWHCAANRSGNRITVSYIINQYDMWMDMKDELGSI